MPRGIFVTGTDTNVGKTVVSAALLHRFRASVPGLTYWKPVQTGIDDDDDTATVCGLGDCDDAQVFEGGVRLPRAVSPHLAARLAGVTIRVVDLVALRDANPPGTRWIIEGAGGVLAPLSDSECVADLIIALGLPVVLVARSGLGTINHSLLSIEALRQRSIAIAGVVMVGDRSPDNRAAIEHHGRTSVIGELPILPVLSTAPLAAWAKAELDPDGRLLAAFQ